MSKEISRRDFLKAAAAGAAGTAVAAMFAGTALASEDANAKTPEFDGKKKFAGIGSVRNVTDDIYYVGVEDL